MDIRGIEVTNQLRSAIRAKLLELGVRYDEELPDYILVMVVNKKSRQQMHEDLYLFLEDSTTPFVDWLHDQVLKKLQKVTVAKKKSTREFVPAVVVKQEEEKKKKKSCTTSFLEDHSVEPPGDNKSSSRAAKEEKSLHKQNAKPSAPRHSPDANNKSPEKPAKSAVVENRPDESSIRATLPEKKTPQQSVAQPVNAEKVDDRSGTANKTSEPRRDAKTATDDKASARSLKRSLDATTGHDAADKRYGDAKKPKVAEEPDEPAEEGAKKLRSCVAKPKITSVVSIKNRLGVASPRKKFEVYREKGEGEGRHRQPMKRFDKHRFDASRGAGFQRGRNLDGDERAARGRVGEPRHHDADRPGDAKSRLGGAKGDRAAAKPVEQRERANSNAKAKLGEKPTVTVKDRLGVASVVKTQKQPGKPVDAAEHRSAKYLEQDREALANNKNVKNRLGPLKRNFRPVPGRVNYAATGWHSQSGEDDGVDVDPAEEEEGEEEERPDDETQPLPANASSLKSRIIAVRKPGPVKIERRRPKPVDRPNKSIRLDDADDEDVGEARLPSKVIVTPRPLKPLQPTQKRATQSLLLRAVAEANQSVVTQKNPEPSLLDKKPALKRLKPCAAREVGQNLSVHLNANKRLVMEKIQVELNTMSTVDTVHARSKPYEPQADIDEHMGVVMSLFQRSDDNQKFLVTLNGYNNNLAKEKTASDDEERLEMEVNEDDELALLANQSEAYAQQDADSSVFRITDTEDDADADVVGKDRAEENNENCNTENVEVPEDAPRKKRKLSPIVYNRSHSPSPVELKSAPFKSAPHPVASKRGEKRPPSDASQPAIVGQVDKSKERCRYWPNCTLGVKCAYLHPSVMCSAFPACKFGDKCAYKHPKCKFGLSCTKLGCVFSHPAQQQCKYHPFCTKPSCPYTHPAARAATVAVETTSQRAKFTWRRRE